MVMGRSQMSKQVTGKLRGARDEKQKKKRVIKSIRKRTKV